MRNLVLYNGPSQLDGKPIVAVLSGLLNPSQNKKTGPMIQSWIIKQDMPPSEAIAKKEDGTVCGDCPLAGDGCYVLAFQAPNQIYDGLAECGVYMDGDADNRIARFGSYGDPTAVPISAWNRFRRRLKGWTGYTRQWKQVRFREFRDFCHASVLSLAEKMEANALGFKTYRIIPEDGKPEPDEVLCPNIASKGLVQCHDCRLCRGATGKNIVAYVHGSAATIKKASSHLG